MKTRKPTIFSNVLVDSFLAVLPLTVLVLSGGCKEESTNNPPVKPNIIFITLESIRADHVTQLGYDRATTPGFDELAKSGTLYSNAHSVTSWTLSSHASMFTGLYPSAHQVLRIRDRLDDEYVTLAELLRDAGYQTTGYISGPFMRKVHNLHQGFDKYDDSMANMDHWASHEDITNPQMEAAITRFLREQRDPSKPFFMFLYFWDPHFDYIPPSPYDTMFVPPNATKIDVTRYEHQLVVHKGISKSQLDYVVSQYDGEIRCTDDLLVRVWGLLRKLDLWDSTAIVLTADHGEDFFEHGKKGHKNDIHAQSVHVPLVIKPPGATKPKRDDRLTSLVDLFPTILDFAGIDYEGECQGRTLLQPAPTTPLPIYFELDAFTYMEHPETGEKWTDAKKWRGMQLGHHKLVALPELNAWDLYDTKADPQELKPLDLRDKLAQLQKMLYDHERAMHAIAQRKGKPAPAQLSDEELKRLESLGYIDRRKSDTKKDD